MSKNLNFKAPFREDHLKVRREGDKEKKRDWLLLRLIIRIASFILKLLEYLRYCFVTKTVPSLCVSITVVGVVVGVIVVESRTSEDGPTSPPVSDVNPEEHVDNSDEPTSEESKDSQEVAESETERSENRNLSEQLEEIVKDVKSGTQQTEGMRQSVKRMNEDAQSMTEKVKRMNEDAQSMTDDAKGELQSTQ